MNMKKKALAALMICGACIAANAQYNYTSEDQLQQQLEAETAANQRNYRSNIIDDIWSNNSYTYLGYVASNSSVTGHDITKVNEDGKFGFFMTQGTSFLFPSHPLANHLKIGFDMNWFDISAAKYNGDKSLLSQGYHDVNRWSILIGAFGIGPHISVAPFTGLYNQVSSIRISAWAHYQPTFGMYLTNFDGDNNLQMAYCNTFQVGAKLFWKFIGVGIEKDWSSGKFKVPSGGYGYDSDIFRHKEKVLRHFDSTRFFIAFSF